ncbi:unnamed protein product, partial [Durusdinium trenchii]
MVGFMKVGPKSLELQLPGCIRWLQKINPSAVVYCPMLNQDAGYASHVLQLPSVALLTTAGPGSMALAMQFFLAGQDPKEVVEQARAHEPVLQSIRHIKDTYGIELDIFSGLETFGYLPILKKADLVMMTTTEDLQDPASLELMERYEKDGVSFVGVGPLLDQKGARRAAGHKFEHEASSKPSTQKVDILKQVHEAKEVGRPVIFASMGTVITGDSDDFGWNVKPQQSSGRQGLTGKQLCQSAFSAVFDAFGAEKVDAKTPLIVLATGPQPDALENLQNSFMKSLSLGVPMVGCPGVADQPANAQKAQAMGVALQVDRPVPVDGEEEAAMVQYRKDVTEALRRVFDEPQFRQRATEVSQGIREAGGVSRATEILLDVAHMVKSGPSLPKLLGHHDDLRKSMK